MFGEYNFKTLVNTSNLINISISIVNQTGIGVLNTNFGTSMDTGFFNNILLKGNISQEPYYNNFTYSVNNTDPQSNISDIVDLLLKIRACQNSQNYFVKNLANIKNQIREQLQRELLFAKSDLTYNQLKQIKNVIKDVSLKKGDFDKLLLSLSQDVKKKINKNIKYKANFKDYILNNSRRVYNINEIESNYSSLTRSILNKSQNSYLLNTNVNLVNRETTTDKQISREIREGLIERLTRVYRKDIESSVQDSYEVLNNHKVSKEVLNNLIENLRINEKDNYKELRLEDKQKEIKTILVRELEEIYNTSAEDILRETLKDTQKVLKQEKVEKEILERLAKITNIELKTAAIEKKTSIIKRLFGNRLSRLYTTNEVNEIESNYSSLTRSILNKSQNSYLLNTNVNLVNRETTTDKQIRREIREGLIERLTRVYKKDIESSVQDSYEVLSNHKVSKEVLNNLIENLRMNEKDNYKELRLEDKQKEIKTILVRELEEIYNTSAEDILRETLKDTQKVLKQEKVEKEILERLAKITNIELKTAAIEKKTSIIKRLFGNRLSRLYTTNEVNEIESNYSSLTRSILNKSQNSYLFNTNLKLVNRESKTDRKTNYIINKLREREASNKKYKTQKVSYEKIISKALNTKSKITVDDFIYNFEVIQEKYRDILKVFENRYLDKKINRHRINTVFRSYRGDRNRGRFGNVLTYLVNSFKVTDSRENPSNVNLLNDRILKSIESKDFINSKKSSNSDFPELYNGSYNFERVYYNDPFGFLFNQKSLDNNDFPKLVNDPGNMIYKLPISQINQYKKDLNNLDYGESALESQTFENNETLNNTYRGNYFSFSGDKDFEESTRKMIEEYVSNINIDVDSISRKVMNQIEKMMKTERRRFGILR